jgi:hypothetical protein
MSNELSKDIEQRHIHEHRDALDTLTLAYLTTAYTISIPHHPHLTTNSTLITHRICPSYTSIRITLGVPAQAAQT